MATATKLRNRTVTVPTVYDWRTSDADEIDRRRERARTESLRISNTDARHPIFSNFRVKSGSGMEYAVEIRALAGRIHACTCVDFRINGLGTCKHVEAVLMYLRARYGQAYRAAESKGSPRIDIVPDREGDALTIERPSRPFPPWLQHRVDSCGRLKGDTPEAALEWLRSLKRSELRISQEVEPWLTARRHARERVVLRREYEQKVQSGEWPLQETLVPLFPYQREGMLHLAFTERALLADEMGLGKTIQAIAACALLHRLGKVSRVLVVTPASLKTEWEEQIQRFTPLPYQLVYGARSRRLRAYRDAPFFTLVNYEQMLSDSLDVNQWLQPDGVILDEAQRIKNWNTKTAQAVKRLRSRYAFILTGTPVENRIDELHSLMDFLNPTVLGPLFRFNRDFYELDERGRPKAYVNLDRLHERIKPFLLRRRKADVETELPARTDRTHLVPLSEEQQNRYADHEYQAARLMRAAKRRPLTQQELDKLMRELAMMRMVCDTNYILNPEERACPKRDELRKILEECRDNPEVKAIVFSEWERMLELVRDLCNEVKLGYAWHTGSVPQRRRRAEINLFKTNPSCRVFLTTDSGGTGLNLQAASIVINCDLPWNPARLEQRIARAWRKHQTRPVTIINLVAEHTIEHKMISTLAVKQSLADGVLDRKGDLKKIPIAGGRQAFLSKLEQLLGPAELGKRKEPKAPPLPVDRALGFCQAALAQIDGAMVRCEERYPAGLAHSVLLLVVDRDAPLWRERLAPLHAEYFGPDRWDPLSPVRFEVIDRATDDALARLTEAGLIQAASRGTRALYPAGEVSGPTPLTEVERQQAEACQAQAARKLKMAALLGEGGLADEARAALLDAAYQAARALAIHRRLAVPATWEDALLPPVSHCWGEDLPMIRAFAQSSDADWKPVAECLRRRLADFELARP